MTRAALRPVLWKHGPLRRLNGTLAAAGPEQAGKYVSARLKMIKEEKKKSIFLQQAAARLRQTNSSAGANVFSKSSAHSDACNGLDGESTLLVFVCWYSKKRSWI